MTATKLWDIRDVGLAGLTITGDMSGSVNGNGNYVFVYTGPTFASITPNASPFSAGSGYYLLLIEMCVTGLGRFRGTFENAYDVGGLSLGLENQRHTIIAAEANVSSAIHYFDYMRHAGNKTVVNWQIWFDSVSILNQIQVGGGGGGTPGIIRLPNIRGGADQ